MEKINVVKAWKDPDYRAELKSRGIEIPNSPVENNLNLKVIHGGGEIGEGNVHSISGECGFFGHVHDCSTVGGFGRWFVDFLYH